MENKRIFITGATGFIGERLALKLAEKNQVTALVRPESLVKAGRLKENGISLLAGDLLNNGAYSEKLDGIDYIFHLAALFNVDAPKNILYKYNVLGTEKLLESCRDKNIQKIIYFSTAHVSGIKEKDFITEDEQIPGRFKNWYEWSKAEGEKRAFFFYENYGLPIVVMRPVIVYGPGSLYGFYSALSLISKKQLWIFPGSGKNRIHLVHVDDVVNAAIHLAQQENNPGEIYHISDLYPRRCEQLMQVACRLLNIRPPLVALPRTAVKFISRLPIWKLLFRGISANLLDYFLYNQTYANEKLRSSGFSLEYPSPIQGLASTVDWYFKNNTLQKN